MAIVIEQEKRKISWFALIVVFLAVLAVVGGTYYLFFAPAPLIEKVTPASVKSLQTLSGIKLQPELIINNPEFQILRTYINPIEIGSAGKSNPFLR